MSNPGGLAGPKVPGRHDAGHATVTGTTCRIGHLNPKNTYAVKVLAQPAAPTQKATVVCTTTK